MAHLFEPLTIKEITLRNRIGVSPMCQYSYRDGISNDWQVVHLGTRAVGGVGLIITEATAVEPRGRITPWDVGIWSDEHIEPLRKVTKVIKENGAVAGIQIAHAGRKACTGQPWTGGKPLQPGDPDWWQVVGASPLPFSPQHQVPVELTVENIGKSAPRSCRQPGAAWRLVSSGWRFTGRTATCCSPFARPDPTSAATATEDRSRTAYGSCWRWCTMCALSGRNGCR